MGFVQHPQERPFFLLGAHSLRQLQIPPGVQIQFHELSRGVILQLANVGQIVFLQGQQGPKQRAAGNNCGGHARDSQLGKILRKVLFQQFFALFKTEKFRFSLVHAAV